MAAPTFIQEAEIAWNNSTTPKTTGSFNVLAGDILVAFAMGEDTGITLSTPSGGSLTWNLAQAITTGSNCAAAMWTAVVDSNKSMTVQFARGANDFRYGGNCLTFRSSDGVGASAKATPASGAPTLNLLTTQANSAIVVCNADWTAQDGTSRTWRTVNSITPTSGNGLEVTYVLDSLRYTVYGAYYSDAGSIATKAVGLSAPSSQTYSLIAVEVKGAAGAAETVTMDKWFHLPEPVRPLIEIVPYF